MRFDFESLTSGMKSVLITAVFDIGTGGAVPAVAPKRTESNPRPDYYEFLAIGL